MQQLINEIKKLRMMGLKKLMTIDKYDEVFYLYRDINEYCVCIPYDNSNDVNEDFVNLKVKSLNLTIDETGECLRLLILSMNSTEDFSKFLYIAVDFVCKENRNEIINNTIDWINSWKDIFGNSIREENVANVLAELICLREIYKTDKSAVWEGPKNGSQDIVCSTKVYEIKSTTKKSNYSININSRDQINKDLDEEVLFVRMELKPYSNSINSVVAELVEMGYKEDVLEDLLSKQNLDKGKSSRKLTYSVLSIDAYEIDETIFPVIDIAELNKLAGVSNIINYSLTLDIGTIPSKKFM